MPATEPLADLARKVLDGAPVDWAAAESSAGHDERPVVRQLRLIEGLAAVHRREPSQARTRTWTPALFSTAPPVEVPQQWGHLRILERIGRGAFGAVYRAWDSRLDREVALKLLPAPRALDDRSSTIIEEGRLLARVRHANVVTIHGAERIGDQIGLWMELVRGQTLEQLLQTRHGVQRRRTRSRSASSSAVRWRPSTPQVSCIATSRPTTSRAPRTAASC